ncbi:hypothetical protein N7448_004823 [Penicillium atrosanguineum]|nr:hypothetical protein N7448_004823 [Penicillium atrosanguineum]
MSASMAATTSATFVAADYSTSADFQGWYLQTTPQPIICASTQTYYTSSTFADCYDPSSSAPIPTGCDGSTLLRGDDSGSDDSEAVLRYGCMINWAANSLYRTLPARYSSSTAAPAKTESASASATATKSHHTATNTDAQSTSFSTSTSISTSTSTSDGSSSSLSGGAIAGIVIGGVAALVILLALIFRKKILALFGKGKPASDDGPAWSPVYMPPDTHSMSQATSNWQTSELSSDQHPSMVHEIGSSQRNTAQAVHELG